MSQKSVGQSKRSLLSRSSQALTHPTQAKENAVGENRNDTKMWAVQFHECNNVSCDSQMIFAVGNLGSPEAVDSKGEGYVA